MEDMHVVVVYYARLLYNRCEIFRDKVFFTHTPKCVSTVLYSVLTLTVLTTHIGVWVEKCPPYLNKKGGKKLVVVGVPLNRFSPKIL